MTYRTLILVSLLFIALPTELFARSGTIIPQKDVDPAQLSAYYDLRNRSSYIQITNTTAQTRTIHVQIFQHDRSCDELNFFDELTANDTVVYNLDNIIKNDGSVAPINLADDSSGYVVVSDVNFERSSLIGNFRIVDDEGYEYRANMAGAQLSGSVVTNLSSGDVFIANFNTADGANYADLVGYAYDDGNSTTVTNYDPGVSFDIFVFDLNEEPLSCDTRVFACGGIMNYGINEDYPASRGNDLLCPGGGL
ncbi:MAG: hypothetical protein GTO02_16885, partial [Candidatus Dadabacteria bacterium]|nr:hypothetical protein [Candidatus Dadabacteria bacterium]NIQ16003.1 hypothetical protein [Candidatus Dadabacteria bacterium]